MTSLRVICIATSPSEDLYWTSVFKSFYKEEQLLNDFGLCSDSNNEKNSLLIELFSTGFLTKEKWITILQDVAVIIGRWPLLFLPQLIEASNARLFMASPYNSFDVCPFIRNSSLLNYFINFKLSFQQREIFQLMSQQYKSVDWAEGIESSEQFTPTIVDRKTSLSNLADDLGLRDFNGAISYLHVSDVDKLYGDAKLLFCLFIPLCVVSLICILISVGYAFWSGLIFE